MNTPDRRDGRQHRGRRSPKFVLAVFHEPENDISPGALPQLPGQELQRQLRGARPSTSPCGTTCTPGSNAEGITNVVWVMNYMGWEGWNCIVNALWPGNAYVELGDLGPVSAQRHVDLPRQRVLTSSPPQQRHPRLPLQALGAQRVRLRGRTRALAYQMYADAKRARQQHLPQLKLYRVWDRRTSSSTDDRSATPAPREGPRRAGSLQPVRERPADDGGRPPSPDSTAPSVPPRLSASSPGPCTAGLITSTDEVGVAGYTVNRGGAPIDSTAQTTFTGATAPVGQRVSLHRHGVRPRPATGVPPRPRSA